MFCSRHSMVVSKSVANLFPSRRRSTCAPMDLATMQGSWFGPLESLLEDDTMAGRNARKQARRTAATCGSPEGSQPVLGFGQRSHGQPDPNSSAVDATHG